MVRQNLNRSEKVTLLDRIGYAREALDAWKNASDTFDDDETASVDLIADLAHLLEKHEIDFEKVIRMARNHWQQERNQPIEVQFDKRELATVIAALRHWQRSGLPCIGVPEDEIASNVGEFLPIDHDEIDQLCERLNISDQK